MRIVVVIKKDGTRDSDGNEYIGCEVYADFLIPDESVTTVFFNKDRHDEKKLSKQINAMLGMRKVHDEYFCLTFLEREIMEHELVFKIGDRVQICHSENIGTVTEIWIRGGVGYLVRYFDKNNSENSAWFTSSEIEITA